MAFIPRSSTQISLLSFSPAVCKAQTRSGSSQHLMAAAKHLSESCFLPSACIAGLSPSLKGNRDFLRFRTHARIRVVLSYQHIWNPWLPMYPKTKTERMYSSPGRSRRMTPFSFLGSSRPQMGLKSDGLLASLLVKRQQHWDTACNP